MGILDALGLGGGTKEQKLKAKILQKYGPPENRQKAIEQLRELGTDEAIRTLLLRFTLRIEPGITDDEDKERVVEIIRDFGERAVGPLKEFLQSRDEIAFPLRALKELVAEKDVIDTVCDILDKAALEYARDPEKRIQLMRHLRDHKDPRIVETSLKFIEDMADDVKIAALEAIEAQGPDDRAREPIIHALLKAHEESNNRVKDAAAHALEVTQLPVKGFRPKVEAALPAGFTLDREGRVKKK